MRRPNLLAIVVVVLASLAGGAHLEAASEIVGAARAVDGDTLEIDDVRIRLFGVDAPETDQSCPRDNGVTWACGEVAAARLAELVGGRETRCLERDRDRYGRVVATCRAGSVDLGAQLVGEGLAWAYRRYSDRYVAAESRAKTTRLGLWRGEVRPAWEYRADRRDARTTPMGNTRSAPPGACRIKGNINAEGTRIYHVPGSRWYDRTRVDESRGQRWFCSEAEARAAGWRPPRGN